MAAKNIKSRGDERRNKLIKLIHVARRELAMQDEDYRSMLAGMPALGGRTSSKDLSIRGLELVRDALIAKGFVIRARAPSKAPVKPSNPGNRRMASDAQSRLIRHLWLKLHGMGEVRDSSEDALAHYVERLTNVADLHWLNNKQVTTVIESLKSWVARAEVPK